MLLSVAAAAFTPLWKKDMPFSFQTVYSPLVPPVLDNTFIAYDEYSMVFALDATTGATKWQTNFTGGATVMAITFAGDMNRFVVIVSNEGIAGYVTVLNRADGTLVWNNTQFAAFTAANLPVMSRDVVLVCSGSPCTPSGYDLYSGNMLYSDTLSAVASIVPCDGDHSIAVWPIVGTTLTYGLIETNTGVFLWKKASADASLQFPVCTANSFIRVGLTATHVVDTRSGNTRFTIPQGAMFALNQGVVCDSITPINYLCYDEMQGFMLFNSTLSTSASGLTAMQIVDGQLQLVIVYAYMGIAPGYTNFTAIDLGSGNQLASIVAPVNAVSAIATGPNGYYIVPFLAGLTAWTRNGAFVTRTTTISGINFMATTKSAVIVAYQNSVAAFTFP